jgi:hypothetical protein
MATEQTAAGRRGSPFLYGLLAIAIVAAILFAVVTLIDQWRGDEAPPAATFGVTVGEIVNQPEQFYGETVTVSGEVNQVLQAFAFTIGGDAFGQGEELLVIGPPPPVGEDLAAEEVVDEMYIVQATGTVHEFDVAAIEQEIGAELDQEVLARFEGQPVLVAEGTVITPRTGAGVGMWAEVDEILANPDDFIGEERTVVAEISEVISEHGFVLAGGLLVINATDEVTLEALQDAQEIEVAGEIVRFDPAEIQTYVTGEVDAEQFAEFEGEPVLIGRAMLLMPEAAAD